MGISANDCGLIRTRYFSSDFPKFTRPDTDGNNRYAVQVSDTDYTHVDRVSAACNHKTLYTPARGQHLDRPVAIDHHGKTYFACEQSGKHALVAINPGFEGVKERWITGPQYLTALPGQPDAIDVTDNGDRVAVAFGSNIQTWTAGEGLKHFTTVAGKVESMYYLPDGALAFCTKSPRPDGGVDSEIAALAPGQTCPETVVSGKEAMGMLNAQIARDVYQARQSIQAAWGYPMSRAF